MDVLYVIKTPIDFFFKNLKNIDQMPHIYDITHGDMSEIDIKQVLVVLL